MERRIKFFSVLLGAFALSLVFSLNAQAKISEQTQQCMECHRDILPGLVEQWQDSTHWQAGVGCYECHAADKGDPDAMEHNGFLVATIVSPRDCAKCHPKEAAEQEASHHAKAGDILNTNDGLLGQTRRRRAAAQATSAACRSSSSSVRGRRSA